MWSLVVDFNRLVIHKELRIPAHLEVQKLRLKKHISSLEIAKTTL